MASSLTRQYAAYYQKASALYQRPQVRASLEIILSVFTVSLLILFAIRPTLTNVASLQKKIEDQEVVLKKADIKLGQLIRAEGQLSENQNRLGLLDDAIPNTFDYFNISKRIEIIGQENFVNLELIRLPGSILVGDSQIPGLTGDRAGGIVRPNEQGLVIIPINFSVKGSQTQVLGFIKDMEKMDLLAVIQDIRIAKEQSFQEAANLLNLDGTAWFYSIELNK